MGTKRTEIGNRRGSAILGKEKDKRNERKSE